MIKVATLDTIHKKSQRLFVLNGLLNMWNYKENQVVEKISDINEPEAETVYVNLKFGKSKTDEFIVTSLGENTDKYFFAIYDKFVTMLDNLNDKVKIILQFILAILLPNILGLALYSITSLLILIWCGVINLTFVIAVITSAFLLIMIVIISMMYFGMFKSTFEKYKSIPNTSVNVRKMSKVNYSQIILACLIYGYTLVCCPQHLLFLCLYVGLQKLIIVRIIILRQATLQTLIVNKMVDNCLLFLYNELNQFGLFLLFILKGGTVLWMNCMQE